LEALKPRHCVYPQSIYCWLRIYLCCVLYSVWYRQVGALYFYYCCVCWAC
jgi:hypothetical protein